MIIRHIKPEPIFYDWIGKNGWRLVLNQEIEVPDEYAFLEKFRAAFAEGHFIIISFNDDDLDAVVQKELKDAIGGGGPGGGDFFHVDKFPVTVFGQTVFPLSKVPTNVNKVVLIVSGIPQEYGVDYSVVGSVLTWLDNDFQLETSDWVQIIYPSSTA